MEKIEIWPGHSLAKEVEVEILSKWFSFDKSQIGLEVGCGDGFESTLLARRSGKMVATDLFESELL